MDRAADGVEGRTDSAAAAKPCVLLPERPEERRWEQAWTSPRGSEGNVSGCVADAREPRRCSEKDVFVFAKVCFLFAILRAKQNAQFSSTSSPCSRARVASRITAACTRGASRRPRPQPDLVPPLRRRRRSRRRHRRRRSRPRRSRPRRCSPRRRDLRLPCP